MKVATASLICASALLSVNADEIIAKKNQKDVCLDICNKQLSGPKFQAIAFGHLENSCPKWVNKGTDTYTDVVSICAKVKAEFSGNAAGSGTLNTGGSGNTLNSGGSGNTVKPAKPVEDKKSSTNVAAVSMMTTLTILGLNFL